MKTTISHHSYYTEAIKSITYRLNDLTLKFNVLSAARLIVLVSALVLMVQAIRLSFTTLMWYGLLCLILFIILVSIHAKIGKKKKYQENLLKINKDELAYVEQGRLSFDAGSIYLDPKHAYTFDLDIFGPKSLYHHMVRAYTYMGRVSFATLLNTGLPTEEIKANQAAVIELSTRISWRQHFSALAIANADTKQDYDKVVAWSKKPYGDISLIYRLSTYIFPALFCIALGILFYSQNLAYFHYVTTLFTINLLLSAMLFKKVKNEIQYASDVAETIMKNGVLLEAIYNEKFVSPKLLALKTNDHKVHNAAQALKKLSSLFSSLDSALNPMGMILSNGSIMLHIHVFIAMQQWKKDHAQYLPYWLDIIGEIEALNSLATFYYNNPEYCFPSINNNRHISFEEMGHPLIHRDKRVCNDVSFTPKNFILLTGSNMSGKSTFLRSLGVNMVLTNIGAPVCAKAANIHPMPVLVAMRQTDSLSDGESYFFAEVKRLHDIVQASSVQVHFVLLDEILRGTNSDDKRSGTIGVIEKVLDLNAIGAIATHDIEVCRFTDDHPSQLTNQCFEVEIKEDELVFDYKLRPGICKNKSATFLMRKMGVIRE